MREEGGGDGGDYAGNGMAARDSGAQIEEMHTVDRKTGCFGKCPILNRGEDANVWSSTDTK